MGFVINLVFLSFFFLKIINALFPKINILFICILIILNNLSLFIISKYKL